MTNTGSSASLEARIAELETKLSNLTNLADAEAFSAGDCTNGCTDGCTRNCTNGCTGGGCLAEAVNIGAVE
jgi:hypothetical protein